MSVTGACRTPHAQITNPRDARAAAIGDLPRSACGRPPSACPPARGVGPPLPVDLRGVPARREAGPRRRPLLLRPGRHGRPRRAGRSGAQQPASPRPASTRWGSCSTPACPPTTCSPPSSMIRLVTYTMVGLLVGWFAHDHRDLVNRLRVRQRARLPHRASEHARLRRRPHDAARARAAVRARARGHGQPEGGQRHRGTRRRQ